jgi:hypothetical protein
MWAFTVAVLAVVAGLYLIGRNHHDPVRYCDPEIQDCGYVNDDPMAGVGL